MLQQIFWVLLVGTVALAASVSAVPVYVMLPLDTISNDNAVNNPGLLADQFKQLKQGGVDGVMTDVWWGLVEKNQPYAYDWSAYQSLFGLISAAGLKVQAALSFHQCGGNVGDTCDIPLPDWVHAIGDENPDIYYTDQNGNRDKEYLSWGADTQAVLAGRTAVQAYEDFMKSFATTFASYLPNTITEVQVGCGPAGELRYPSYQMALGWQFPGVGQFQCYDKYMLASLANAAAAVGHPEWGHAGPDNAGSYNDFPDSTGFFGDGFDNFASPYGQFFLSWYSNALIAHGDAVMAAAARSFPKVQRTTKVAGVHWWYTHKSHAAELTAGYKNDGLNGYLGITRMLKNRGASIDFTCMEMRDNEQKNGDYAPEELVAQVFKTAISTGIKTGGENALPRFDDTAYSQIEKMSTIAGTVSSFTYLRLVDSLLSEPNWSSFTSFVASMHGIQSR